ncbi:MAG: hypothetical protein AAF388_06105 [Bacteroidota bacterium]
MLASNFSFNPKRFNLWPIYDTIKKYYPIGISRDSEIYGEYEGMKELEEVLKEKNPKPRYYDNYWESFEQIVQQKIGFPLESTTDTQTPSFSAFLTIESFFPTVEERNVNQMALTTELHFCVSLLGPFYTVYGVRKGVYLVKHRKRFQRQSLNANIVNIVYPCGEFETPFLELNELILDQFDGYKFVPYSIFNMEIEGLQVHYGEGLSRKIYYALFNDSFNFHIPIVEEPGHYGFQDWIADYPLDGGYWT